MYKENSFDIGCACGCSLMRISQYEDKEGFEEVYIEQFIPNFYALQKPGWNKFKNALKMIWCIIRGKEYTLFDIVITDKKSIVALKKYVAQLEENIFEYK